MTTIQDLYKKKIDRPLNPAVSAEDFAPDTVKTEIEEYVFTDDIINGLYNVLYHIKVQDKSHDGIWINGFFGSGKSHFLKYLGYCINPLYREAALERLQEAVEERDPNLVDGSKSEVQVGEMRDLAQWLRKADVEVVLFNIGAVHDTNSQERQVFTQVFWNQFNRHRGYNSFNLALAQRFEKVLDSKGVFSEFMSRMADLGFDWASDAETLINTEPGIPLDVACELVPTLDKSLILKSVMEDRINVSPEAFCSEIAEYITRKDNKNFRLLFLVDEVSQFISNNTQLLLQLQEIVTGLHNHCKDQAWVACTAQQDLSELLSNMQILETAPDYGKIMGRFEVRVSLKGTQTEYITQKRLLEKTPEGAVELKDLYKGKQLALANQFSLPSAFYAFRSEDDFVGYYPFVPYQFSLIMKVLDAFGKLRYIDSQSRGNERSIIKITHSTAIAEKDHKVGRFVSFDRFYNAMFQGSLMASGQKSIQNANAMIQEYEDRDFAQRVVNVLFMICNLDGPNRMLFPATLEHIVTLLMEDVDTNKAELINRTERALAFLDRKHIIRSEPLGEGTGIEVYCFQSEDEIDAAREIDGILVDTPTMAKFYFEIIRGHFGLSADRNREPYCSRNFTVGWNILNKTFYSNNADIVVDWPVSTQHNGTFGFRDQHTLTFDIGSEIAKDKLLSNDIFWYCQVQKFVSQGANSQQREKTIRHFQERAADVRAKRILPKMAVVLNKCAILSGDNPLNVTVQGPARYKAAMEAHLGRVFQYAKLGFGGEIPETLDKLRQHILEPVGAQEYALKPISQAESLVEQYISSYPMKEVYVSEVLRNFAGRPYGWSDITTAYFINELRRRGVRSLKYINDANIDSRVVAQNLVRDSTKFTIVAATAISQELVNQFIEAWKRTFNLTQAPQAYDPSELYRLCKETATGERHVSTSQALKSYRERRDKLAGLPFIGPIDEAIELLERWDGERDHKAFFDLVIAEQPQASSLIDRCKEIFQFVQDHEAAYRRMLDFLDDNRENFEFIADKEKVQELKAVKSDPWPFPNMTRYVKLQRELAKELAELTKSKREEVRRAYEEAIEEVQHIAAENEVAYTTNPAMIDNLTRSDKLHVLALNANNVADWRAQQVQWIMNHIPVTPPTPPKPGSQPPVVPKPVTKMISLKTGSSKKIKTEADVDAYLAGLRSQLMAKLTACADNEYLMVK